MEQVKNSIGKTVCYVDPANYQAEIVFKGYKTVIQFMPDSTCKITNLQQE